MGSGCSHSELVALSWATGRLFLWSPALPRGHMLCMEGISLSSNPLPLPFTTGVDSKTPVMFGHGIGLKFVAAQMELPPSLCR